MAFVHIQHYGVRHSFLSRLPTTVRSLRLKAYIDEKVVHLPPRYTVALLTKLCGREKLPLGWRFKLNLGKLKRRIAGLLSHDLIERKRLLITDDTCRIEDGDRQGRGGFPFDTDSHLHYIFLTHPISTFLDGPRHQQTPDNPFRDCRGFAYFFLPRYC